MNEEKEVFTTGVDALIGRMQTHPEEFFGDSGRWRFMYKEHFRDVMTESEKGRLHEALKVIRRMEFDSMVVKELMKDEREEQEELDLDDENPFRSAPIKREGATVKYDTSKRHKFNRVQLTATDMEMAKKLNVPLHEYVKNKVKWTTKLTPEGYEVTETSLGQKFINGMLVK